MFKAGYTAGEIGKKIGRSKCGIQKEIQKIKMTLVNLSEIEKQAKIKSIERQEVIKAINYETNSYISSRALIDKNRNHYITNKNGDLVLKKGNYEYTSDMPRRLINAEGREFNKTFT